MHYASSFASSYVPCVDKDSIACSWMVLSVYQEHIHTAVFSCLQGVALALSLHAPNQALRMTIVPTAETWNLDALMEVRTVLSQELSTVLSTLLSIGCVQIKVSGIHCCNGAAYPAGSAGI